MLKERKKTRKGGGKGEGERGEGKKLCTRARQVLFSLPRLLLPLGLLSADPRDSSVYFPEKGANLTSLSTACPQFSKAIEPREKGYAVSYRKMDMGEEYPYWDMHQ